MNYGETMENEKKGDRRLPDPIRGIAPEELARRMMERPPKKEWRFMKRKGKP